MELVLRVNGIQAAFGFEFGLDSPLVGLCGFSKPLVVTLGKRVY